MRHQIELLDFAAGRSKSGAKVTMPRLLFLAVEFSFGAVTLRGGRCRTLSTHS